MERISQLNNQLSGNDMFTHLAMAPADPILGTTIAFRKDTVPIFPKRFFNAIFQNFDKTMNSLTNLLPKIQKK